VFIGSGGSQAFLFTTAGAAPAATHEFMLSGTLY
jgi:hypothetical protein